MEYGPRAARAGHRRPYRKNRTVQRIQLNDYMNFISLLLFIATCLITNSHFDTLYGSYSFLSTGGMIGNGLFFFVSGYTMYLSLQRIRINRNEIIFWFTRRFVRIYPAYWVYLIVNQVVGVMSGGGFSLH